MKVGAKADPAAEQALQHVLDDKLKDVRAFVLDEVRDHFDVYGQYLNNFAADYQKRQREQASHDKAQADMIDATLLGLTFFFAPEVAGAGATAALTAILTKEAVKATTEVIAAMKEKLAGKAALLVVKQLSDNLKKGIGDKLSDSHSIFDKLVDYCNTVSKAMTANRNQVGNMVAKADMAQLVLLYSAILAMPKQTFRSEMERHLATLEKKLSGQAAHQDATPQQVNHMAQAKRVDTALTAGIRFDKKIYAATIIEMHWAKQEKTATQFALPEVVHYQFVRWIDGDPAPKIDKTVGADQFVDEGQKPKSLEEPMVRYMLRDERTEEDP